MQSKTRGLHPTRDLIKDWRKGDAEKIATMENEADAVWPGGGGWQATAKEFERWIRQGDLLAAFVTEDGDRIVSLCNLNAKPGQKEYSYIPHLVCHPDYHGKKHGKTVLHTTVEYAYQTGFRKVDLHTWSGNMKAVPLYKKMGFMWQPETTVFMENFTPAARRHPLGAAYFARHDWYDTLERALDLEEDLVTRGKVRVYEYRWRAANGDFLRMVFDRQSWRLVEVENDALLATCSLPDEKLVAGVPHPVRWKLVNKKPAPVQVFLSAGGDPGVDISQRETLELSGEIAIESTFTVDPEIPEKSKDPTAALLNTELIFDGAGLELSAGIGVRQAVGIHLEPPRAVVLPGEPQQVALTLHSNLDAKATVRLSVRPVHNASVSRRAYQVELKPKSGAEVCVDLLAISAGAAALDIEASATVGRRKIPIKTKRIDLLSVERGGLAGAVGEDTAFLCSNSLMLFASRRNGNVDVHHRLRGRRASRLHLRRPQIGPPFSWDDLFQEKAEASIERDERGVVLLLRSRSVLHPGVVLDRRIRLDQGPLVEIVDAITNGSVRSVDLKRIQGWWMQGRTGVHSQFCAPGPDGIRVDYPFPGGRDLSDLRLAEEGEKWPQGWLCRQDEDGPVTGVIWDRAEVVEARFGGEVRQEAGRLKPGQSLTMPPFYGYVGDGTYQTVQNWWQLLFGPPVSEAETPQLPPLHPFELALRPDPLVVAAEGVKVDLSLRSAGFFKFSGKIAVQPDSDLRADVKTVDVTDLTADSPVLRTVQLRRTRKSATGSRSIALRFETDEAIYKSKASVLLLPSRPKPVEVARDGDLFTIDNGILSIRVAPGFSGSVVSLEYRGQEFFNSSFPEGGQRGWRNPWHGGIHPTFGRLWGRLHREKFRARVVRRKGAQGLVWHGVRLTCKIAQEDARGHTLFFDYLLAPGADVLALFVGRRDRLGMWSEGEVGFNIWSALADAPDKATFHTPHVDRIVGLAAPHWSPDHAWKWGGLVGRRSGALFLSHAGERTQAGGWSEGPEGCVLFGELNRPLPAGETIEGLFFVVPASDLKEAQERAVWSEFGELP